ncbi:PIN domain-containing protein [Candidatus Bathyarchaeota archaeon]|nr:PIN domain-containing protein [Candidatus Bathyarchaeota archaeon]
MYLVTLYREAGKLEKIIVDRNAADEAVHLSSVYGVHRLDALHAALARMNHCLLVTFDRDLRHAARMAGVDVTDPRSLV